MSRPLRIRRDLAVSFPDVSSIYFWGEAQERTFLVSACTRASRCNDTPDRPCHVQLFPDAKIILIKERPLNRLFVIFRSFSFSPPSSSPPRPFVPDNRAFNYRLTQQDRLIGVFKVMKLFLHFYKRNPYIRARAHARRGVIRDFPRVTRQIVVARFDVRKNKQNALEDV